jgi:hypothetical protein
MITLANAMETALLQEFIWITSLFSAGTLQILLLIPQCSGVTACPHLQNICHLDPMRQMPTPTKKSYCEVAVGRGHLEVVPEEKGTLLVWWRAKRFGTGHFAMSDLYVFLRCSGSSQSSS